MNQPRSVTFEEMVQIADNDLIDAIHATICKFTNDQEIIVSAVEMAIAITLAIEVGSSSSSSEEIDVQIEAYAAFMRHFARFVRAEKLESEIIRNRIN